MNQRDLAINGILLVCIAAVVYLLVIYRPVQVEDPRAKLAGSIEPEVSVSPETPDAPSAEIGKVAMNSVFVEVDPFRTILTPTPTPTPTPPPPKPFPRINAVMAQYELLMMDPSRGTLTLQKKGTADMLKWTKGETKELPYRNDKLKIKLEKIDRNDFSAEFTARDTEAADSGLQNYGIRFF